jgi:hypothetical protein
VTSADLASQMIETLAGAATLDRARTRDQALFGSATEVERRHRNRDIPAQQLYFDTPADRSRSG